MDELAEFVGDVCSRQLDRTKPLWQMYIVEGLENGNFALVTKMHHSTIDGVSGAELLAKLFDLDARPGADEPRTERIRSGRTDPVGRSAGRAGARDPPGKAPRIARLAWKTAFAMLDVRKVRRSRTESDRQGSAARSPRRGPR